MAKIAVVGGTGDLGNAIAKCLVARTGHQVSIGSRSAESAAKAAAALGEGGGSGGNPDVGAAADIVIVTVPYAAQAGTLESIREAAAGKIVVDTTVPLVPPR